MKAGRLTWDATTTIELRDAEGHHVPTSPARGRSPITRQGPHTTYKPCAWTVTDHVMDINSSVRLASALAEPCTAITGAHAELVLERAPIRSLEANARRYSE